MTHDQYSASDPAHSVWVSASAGTGKTKVLTDRVLRLLLGGSEPAKILCITYTKAAAAEIRHRIEEELGAWAIFTEADLKASLTRLTGKMPAAKTLTRARQLFTHVLDAPDGIRIQTIHGFCQSVLTRFPLEAGVAPHFTRIDEHTSGELLREARTRLFTDSRANGDGGLAKAITALATLTSETGLENLMENIVRERRKLIPWFEDEKSQLITHLYSELGVKNSTTLQTLLDTYFRYSDEEKQALRQACSVLAQGSGNSDKKTLEAILTWLKNPKDHDAYTAAFITRENEPRKLVYTKALDKHGPALGETLRAEQQRVLAFFNETQTFKIAEINTHVITLAKALLGLYHRHKALHNYVDFDDLILHTRQLFERDGMASWVLYKLDGGIDHLLIDEAQDTSPDQWRLVEILAGEFFAGAGARKTKRTLFIVGDEKQSIFSFQGADPHAFDQMQRRLARHTTETEASFRRVQLSLSFRSARPVLAAVDSVFAQYPARDGVIFGEADISHEAHRTEAAGRVELWPLVETKEDEDSPAWQAAQISRQMIWPEAITANSIAETIASWLREKKPLLSKGRPITPSDIMILVQRRGGFADMMLRALKCKNIPVAGADRLILTEHIAVEDIISLAEFLLLPEDDLTLATVLRSPFIGLSEEALFDLAYGRGDESLWQRLKANTKFNETTEFLLSLLARTDYVAPHELFTHILETCQGRRKLGLRLGSEIDDPLNEFLSLTLEYERTHSPSLQGFLYWLDSSVTEVKRDMEKGKGEVRIMTVHGAKGLQAPIVFLPDGARAPLYKRDKDGILWTGKAQTIPLWSPFSGYDDLHYKALRQTKASESVQENRRLLYVAMTRAEDELYITGWRGKKELPAECWYELIRKAAESGWIKEGEKWTLSSNQTRPAIAEAAVAKEVISKTLPAWTDRKAPSEPALPKPLTPSRMESYASVLSPVREHNARERGLLIHRLLQYLPDIAPENRPQALAGFMQQFAGSFSDEESRQIEKQMMAILNDPQFSHVFSKESVVEAPISGVVAGIDGTQVAISGQIDRLCVLKNDVYIVDYKTQKNVPGHESHVPKSYVRQMDAYRRLIAGIYPDKTIHCALLWTSTPQLMVLSESVLSSLAA